MKVNFMPKTCLGKWSVKCLAGFIGLYLLSLILVGLGMRHERGVTSIAPAFQLFLMAAGILALVCGIAAFGIGVVGIIKEKERSVLVFLSAIIGTLVLIFILGEFLIPH